MIDRLPKNWRMVKLGACLQRRKDTVMPVTLEEATINLVGLEDIQDGGRGGITVRPTNPKELQSLKTRFKTGDILYGKLRPYLNKVGIAQESGICSTEIWALVPHSFLDTRFATFFLASSFFVDRVASLTKGANLPRLDTDAFDSTEIPLPPLSEQQLIVEMLQEVEEIRRLRADAEAKTAELIPAMFFKFFGDDEDQFESRPMREIVSEFRYGTSQSSGERGTTTLRIPNIIGDRISFDDLVKVDEGDEALDRLQLQTGDILFVRTNGNSDYVGRCGVFDLGDANRALGGDVPVIFASYLIRARLKLNLMRPWFLHAFLRSPIGRARVLKQARTAAGQYNINTEGLGSISVPVPPLALQDQFLSEAIESQQIAETMRISGRKMEKLDASLSAKALSGRLTADRREAHAEIFATEARERDAALKEAGATINRFRRATIQEMDKIFEQPTDGIYSDLNREQRDLLFRIQQRVGGVGYARYFSAESISKSLEGSLRRNPQAIEGHLAVFAARGLIIPVSREEQTEDTGEFVFGNAYRLPLRDRSDPLTDEEGIILTTESGEALTTEGVIGDASRGRELERLAAQLEKERNLT